MSILSQLKQSQNTDFPNLRPSLDLRFALAKKLDPRITFTRGSTGTYFGPDGIMRTAGVNEPRFDYDPITGQSLGLLIEESRQNLLTYSSEFDTNWNGNRILISIVSSNIVSPDGTTNAVKQVETITNGLHRNGQGVSKSAVATTYTFSIFVKAGERNGFEFGISDAGGYVDCFVNAKTGLFFAVPSTNAFVLGSYGSTPYPNGWYRFYVTATTTAQTSVNVFYNTTRSFGSANNYIGDGTSGIYIWGAQLEAEAFPTSYIPTVASTVTRSADLASMTGTNFSSWYNSSEGTLYAAARLNALGSSGYLGIAYVDDGTTDNCIGFYINDAGDDKIGAEAYISGRAQYTLFSSSATTANKLNKVISSYSTNNFSAAFDTSSQIQRDTFGSIPTVNRLGIGALRGGVYLLNGTISSLTYYPIQLTNQQLINLVS